MHLGLLAGALLALAGGLPAHWMDSATTANAGHSTYALFSIAAQAGTPTATISGVLTGTTTTSVQAVTTAVTTPSVGAAITATAGISGAGSITGTSTVPATSVTLPTPTFVPQEVATPQATLKLNPFDMTFLTTVPSPPMGPFAWAYLALMAALFGASAYFYFYKRPEWKRTNPVLNRAVNRWGMPGLWVAGLGLLFLLFRVVSLDFFNLRFWLYLWLLAAIGLAAWFAYWYRTSYPKEIAKYTKTQRARQYMPGTAAKGPVRPSAGGSTPAKTTTTVTTTTTPPVRPKNAKRKRK